MVNIEFEKTNGLIEGNFGGNYSIALIDIALKDVCILLKLKSKETYKFTSSMNGYLNFTVSPYKEELSDKMKTDIDMRLMPINNVEIDHSGFSFDEIKLVMESFYNQLPDHLKSHFMYDVDFENLEFD